MASVRTLRPPVEAVPGAPPRTAADFPGCRPVRLPRQELDDCEMRMEYWDAASETAWICDPVSSYHEGPAHRLASQKPPLCVSEADFLTRLRSR